MSFVRLDPPPVVVSSGVIVGKSAFANLAALSDPFREGTRRMDRYTSLGYAAAAAAVENADRRPSERGDAGWGVVVGSSLGCWASNAEYLSDVDRRPARELSPALFSRTVANEVNGEICIAHGFGGINQTVVSGWAAGAQAVVEAAAALTEGRVHWVLAGGVESPDESIRRMYVAPRGSSATPGEIAVLCLLTLGGRVATAGSMRIRSYWRGYDPRGGWSLFRALEDLRSPSIGSVVVTNTVPPEVVERWREESRGARFVYLPDLAGELGAAGAPLALAKTELWTGQDGLDGDGVLILARGVEGDTVALVSSL